MVSMIKLTPNIQAVPFPKNQIGERDSLPDWFFLGHGPGVCAQAKKMVAK